MLIDNNNSFPLYWMEAAKHQVLVTRGFILFPLLKEKNRLLKALILVELCFSVLGGLQHPQALSPSGGPTIPSTSQLVDRSSVPPPAQGAGYTNLIFDDEFLSLNMSPNGCETYTWYNGIWYQTLSPSDITTSNSVLTLTQTPLMCMTL